MVLVKVLGCEWFTAKLIALGHELKVFNNELFFSAYDYPHGYELWKFDGTSASLVADINPGSDRSLLLGFAVFNNELFFAANDGTNCSLD